MRFDDTSPSTSPPANPSNRLPANNIELMNDDDVSILVAALRRGDERAWREVMDRYGRLVYSVAARSGLHATDREDVYQTTWLVALRSIDKLRDPTRFTSWLYGITHRLSADMHRKRKRRGTEIDVTDSPSSPVLEADPEVEQGLELLEAVSHLYDALESIDARCATLIRALYLEEPRPSYDTISDRLEMPIGSIGPTRARCLGKIKRLLEERGD